MFRHDRCSSTNLEAACDTVHKPLPVFKTLLDIAHALADRVRRGHPPVLPQVDRCGKQGRPRTPTIRSRPPTALPSAPSARPSREHFPDHGIIGEEFGRRRVGTTLPLGHRSHRRDARLHHRHAAVGHAHRPPRRRQPDPRPHGPALHDASAFWSGADAAHLSVSHRQGTPRIGPRAPARGLRERRADERRRPTCSPSGAETEAFASRQGRGAHDALRRRLLRLLPARVGASSTSSSRRASSPTTSSR